MVEGRHIHFAHHHALDSDERRREQPVGPLVELVLGRAPSLVADVGAGTGYFALPLAERLTRGRVVCLDLEPRMLEVLGERARERNLADRVETLLMDDAGSLPLADASADVALLVNLYHELDDRPRFLAELRRTLRPGGLLLASDWRPEGAADHGPRPEHRVGVAAATRELELAGFAPVEEHPLYRDHWVLSGARSG